MASLLERLFAAGIALSDRQPLLALLLGSSLATAFLVSFLPAKKAPNTGTWWTAYSQLARLLWALFLTLLLALAASTLRSYLHNTTANFRWAHGRVTEVNLQAVRTIWGVEQEQMELKASLTYEEKTTEKLTSEDPTQAALIRETTKKVTVPMNPFLSARHEIALTQSPRRKGSAVYAGYQTDCRFSWKLRNPADRQVHAAFSFPLPASTAVLDALEVSLNGASALDRLQMGKNALVLEKDLGPGEEVQLCIAFRSRGLSYWYFQVQELRELRDFNLSMDLPDLPRGDLNYPEGCMPPTRIEDTEGGKGCRLAWALDHAVTGKGMGVSLPSPKQPGTEATALLEQAEIGWVLLFAFLLAGTALSGTRLFPLVSVSVGLFWALGFGLMGSLHDTCLGFWGAAGLALLGALAASALVLKRILEDAAWRLTVPGLTLFGVAYPLASSLDAAREALYLDLGGLAFLLLAAALFLKRSDAD